MNRLRAFFLRHHTLALIVVMAALCMKAAVPGGVMIGQDARIMTVRICDNGLGQILTKQMAIPLKGSQSDAAGKQGPGECPFSGLAMASLSGAGGALLALALLFILALGFAPVRRPPTPSAFHLRPPLRGPPAIA